ncbi:MAG: penicillin-binding protein 1B [Thiomargarita sp.]|nr:penicillin-binding protein 1B [Thiomargarita sp.]
MLFKKSKKKTAGPKKRPVYRFRWGVLLLIIMIPILSFYVAKLDIQVRQQFEGKKWAIPARVYARPLEFHTGKRVTPESLREELNTLGYRKQKNPSKPGQYWEKGNTFLMTTRTFQFWDGTEPSRTVKIRLIKDKVDAITEISPDRPIHLLRLEPKLIDKIYPEHNEDRILVRLEDVPQHLIDALLTVEDRNFFEHWGVSVRGVVRAIIANFKAGKRVQGGSTLTQQLVKNFYLTSERTLTRKVKEAIMSVLLEWHYTKEQILETYLNEIYLGQAGKRAIHGMGLASRFYFNRPVEEINVAQSALLVSLVRGASYYNPRRHAERARKRRDLVLDVMAAHGKITAEQAEESKKILSLATKKKTENVFPYPAFMELVRRQLREDYNEQDLREEGLQIITTLDPFIQTSAEQAMKKGLKRLEKKRRKARNLQGAMIVTDSQNGEVLAMVNGKRTEYSGFNRPLKAKRLIGSLLKPIVYLTALEDNDTYNLMTQLDDSPYQVKMASGKKWQPYNYDHRTHENAPLYKALSSSYNVALVRLGMTLGLNRVRNTLRRLGFERKFNMYPSMLLGSLPMTPLEVTQIYQTIASGGFRMPMRTIHTVLNLQTGQALQRYPLSVSQNFDPAPIYLLNYAMQHVVRHGTGRHVGSKLPKKMILAGKTGTTNDLKDSWFVGFGNDLLTVTWVGRDDNKPMGLTGGSGAMFIWGNFIKTVRPKSLAPSVPDNIYWEMDEKLGQVPFIRR